MIKKLLFSFIIFISSSALFGMDPSSPKINLDRKQLMFLLLFRSGATTGPESYLAHQKASMVMDHFRKMQAERNKSGQKEGAKS